MTLNEFITFCKLSGLIGITCVIDSTRHKSVITQGNTRLEIVYSIAGDGYIIRNSVSIGSCLRQGVLLEDLVAEFFPDK